MKKLILLLLLTVSVSSAQTKPTYQHWSFSHGCFTAIFTNNTSFHVVGVGTSDAPFGTFTLCCVQHYLEFIKKLYDYGGMTAHLPIRGFTRIDDTDVPGITITLQNSHPYILIVDSDGAVWKLTKAQAYALVPVLQQQSNVIQMTTCPDPNCICTQNQR